MIKGLYTSALGMATQMQKMDVVSNNIANADTTGYKRDMVVTRSFSEELMRRLDDPADIPHDVGIGRVSQGVFVDDVWTDFTNGSLRNVGGPLNLALEGDGFFTVQATGQDGNIVERYTRQGSFTRAADGSLVTQEGYKVLGENGPVTLPPNGSIAIDDYGRVTVDDEYIDTLKLTSFTDNSSLRKVGGNLLETTGQSQSQAYNGTVRQGFLENSNVNSVREMVDMITVSRTYEANSRLISLFDSTLARTVNDIARK